MAAYRSFLFPGSEIGDGFLILDARESHHLVRVFRARKGEAIQVLDGCGTYYHGHIEIADAKAVRVAVGSVESVPTRATRITLVQAVPKGKSMDLILRMATEIGATAIQPVFTDHGEVQIKGERLDAKAEKWRVTMIEACKQCGLAYLPTLSAAMPLRVWLRDNPMGSRARGIVASLEAGSRPLLQTLRESAVVGGELIVAVGPEGDFSGQEYAMLREAGFLPVRLGANILRAETAAAYLLSVADQVVS